MAEKQSPYSIARGTAAFPASTGAAGIPSGIGLGEPTAREKNTMVRAMMTLRPYMIAWIEEIEVCETRCLHVKFELVLEGVRWSDELNGDDGAPLLYPAWCGMLQE